MVSVLRKRFQVGQLGMLGKIWAAIENNKAWKLYRHGAAFRTLLVSLGIWTYIVSAGTFIVGAITASLVALPIWGKILFGLGVTALLLFLAGLVVAAWKVYRHPAAIIPGPSMSGFSATLETRLVKAATESSVGSIDAETQHLMETEFNALTIPEKIALKCNLQNRRVTEQQIRKTFSQLGIVGPEGEMFNYLNSRTRFMDRDFTGNNGIKPEYKDIVTALLEKEKF
jgi:hypothetical protein